MSEHVRDIEQVGRETVLRARMDATPIASIFAEGTAPYAIVRPPTAEPTRARRVWPWLTGAIVLAAAVTTAFVMFAQRSERIAFEERFPIVVDATDRAVLEDDAARWSRGKGRLLAALTRFAPPALDTLTGAGACPLAIDDAPVVGTGDDPDAVVSTRMIVLPGESLDGLDVIARDEIDRMIAASEHGRFRTEEGKLRVLRAIRGAFVVAMITEHQVPGLDRDGIASLGSAVGVAYAFDPATGVVRCAGSFRVSADEASFEPSTVSAISSSLRAID